MGSNPTLSAIKTREIRTISRVFCQSEIDLISRFQLDGKHFCVCDAVIGRPAHDGLKQVILQPSLIEAHTFAGQIEWRDIARRLLFPALDEIKVKIRGKSEQ